MAKAGRGDDQYMVRFPPGIRDQIKKAADAAGRSMNTEIVSRLEETFLEIPFGNVLRVLIDLEREVMSSSTEEILLNPSIQHHLRAMSDERGISPKLFASTLVIEAMMQIEMNTDVGRKIADRVMAVIEKRKTGNDDEYESEA